MSKKMELIEGRYFHKYTSDHLVVNHRCYKVCDRCATVNEKDNKSCINCGSEGFTKMSENEAKLLASTVRDRDYFKWNKDGLGE